MLHRDVIIGHVLSWRHGARCSLESLRLSFMEMPQALLLLRRTVFFKNEALPNRYYLVMNTGVLILRFRPFLQGHEEVEGPVVC